MQAAAAVAAVPASYFPNTIRAAAVLAGEGPLPTSSQHKWNEPDRVTNQGGRSDSNTKTVQSGWHKAEVQAAAAAAAAMAASEGFPLSWKKLQWMLPFENQNRKLVWRLGNSQPRATPKVVQRWCTAVRLRPAQIAEPLKNLFASNSASLFFMQVQWAMGNCKHCSIQLVGILALECYFLHVQTSWGWALRSSLQRRQDMFCFLTDMWYVIRRCASGP